MLYDSNSVSLMSIDNSSSSEPCKKFSPAKFASKTWWEEVEAAEQTVFKQEESTDTEATQETKKCIKTENESVTTMDPDMLTFTNKINVKDEKGDEDDVKTKDESDYQFLDRTNESNNSTASNSRDITLEFLDSSNGDKYDRLVRDDVKIKTPCKRRLSGDSRSNSPISFFALENENDNVKDDAESALISTEDNRAQSATSSHTTASTGRSHAKRRRCNQPIETSVEVLARRQKQIDYGKNTIGYDNYIKQVPRNKRTKDHPWTPPKQFKYSRRAFDGLIKGWRTKLHCFDPPNYKGSKDESESSESGDDDDEDEKK